jgi:hypothetical protein
MVLHEEYLIVMRILVTGSALVVFCNSRVARVYISVLLRMLR